MRSDPALGASADDTHGVRGNPCVSHGSGRRVPAVGRRPPTRAQSEAEGISTSCNCQARGLQQPKPDFKRARIIGASLAVDRRSLNVLRRLQNSAEDILSQQERTQRGLCANRNLQTDDISLFARGVCCGFSDTAQQGPAEMTGGLLPPWSPSETTAFSSQDVISVPPSVFLGDVVGSACSLQSR